MVRHTCDNPPCCNPAHLVGGTTADNVRDMDERGRRVHGDHKGEANGFAKVTSEQVVSMREAHENGKTLREIALQHGVSKSAVQLIVARKAWTHV